MKNRRKSLIDAIIKPPWQAELETTQSCTMKDTITNILDQLNIWIDIWDMQTWRYENLTSRRLKSVELISQFVCNKNIWGSNFGHSLLTSVELTVPVSTYECLGKHPTEGGIVAILPLFGNCWRSLLSILILILTLVSAGRPGRDAESV